MFNFVEFSDSLTEFSLKIARSYFEKNEKLSISMSPTSLYLSLILIEIGSQETTKDQLQALLGKDYSNLTTEISNKTKRIKQSISDINSILYNSTKYTNKIFTNVYLEPEFKKFIEEIFNIRFENIPYTQSSKSCKFLNNLISEKTNGKIIDLIFESSLRPDVSLLLINAIYMKSEWEEEFNETLTKIDKFYLENGSTVDIKMMYCEHRAEIYEDEKGYVSLIKKFKKSNIDAIFIIPPKGKCLKEFIFSFNKVDLINFLTKSIIMMAEIFIPKCIIKKSIAITEILKQSGLTSIFDQNDSNLKSMTPENTFISDIYHSSTVSITEKGERRSSSLLECGASMSYGYVFRADRPFILIIWERLLEIPLFINAIYDPS